ncbi:MAG: hypothetical protein KDD04_04355 [Sinomicrobium sp.]|nr:hypothetical protein [Sinomicrobium sp.]
MRKKLVSELKDIAQSILNMQEEDNVLTLKTKVRTLYEKLIVMEAVEAHYGEVRTEPEKSEATRTFEALAAGVIRENTQVPENNPHEEDLVEPVMHKIKDLVNEMCETETLDDILSGVKPEPVFVKKEGGESVLPGVSAEKHPEPRKLSLNDVLKKQIQIGLNDRIGFVKHLFDGSNDDFDKTLSLLSGMSSLDEARDFVINIVKPDYNDWKGKEDYELRFLALIEARFDS